MSRQKWWGVALGLTFLFEALTLLLRFGGGLESNVHTAFLAGVTLGLRIHHGYIGLMMLATLPLVRRYRPQTADWTAAVGVALLASDLLHHFVVLWPATGSPCFDFFYPLH